MIFRSYKDNLIKKNQIIDLLKDACKNSGTRFLTAEIADYSRMGEYKIPSVTLSIDRRNGIECSLFVEIDIQNYADDRDETIYLVDKKFKSIDEAVDAFFKKVEETEAFFEVELEVNA